MSTKIYSSKIWYDKRKSSVITVFIILCILKAMIIYLELQEERLHKFISHFTWITRSIKLIVHIQSNECRQVWLLIIIYTFLESEIELKSILYTPAPLTEPSQDFHWLQSDELDFGCQATLSHRALTRQKRNYENTAKLIIIKGTSTFWVKSISTNLVSTENPIVFTFFLYRKHKHNKLVSLWKIQRKIFYIFV